MSQVTEGPMAPIALFVYNRPDHTARILSELATQEEAAGTDLYIFSDGPKPSASTHDIQSIEEVRAHCERVASSFRSFHLLPSTTNKGLARSVIDGIEHVLADHNRIIVVEDDLHLSPFFLRFMNEALETYKDVPEVAHINAGTFFDSPELPSGFLLRFIGSWGWATWRDRWQTLWNEDGMALEKALSNNPAAYERFTYSGTYNFNRMLHKQILGLNNSWAVRWHAALMLEEKLSYNPSPALASNEGFDGSGTHSSNDNQYHTKVAHSPVPVTLFTPPVEDPTAYRVITRVYRKHNSKWYKGIQKIKTIYRNLTGKRGH